MSPFDLLASRLSGDRRGVAALEFCLIAPALVLVLGGVFQLSCWVQAYTSLDHATHGMAKMIAQSPTGTSPTELAKLCSGLRLEMAPYMPGQPAASLSATVASYSRRAASGPGQFRQGVDWQYGGACPGSGAMLPAQTLATLKALSPVAGDAWIVVRSSFVYRFPVAILPISSVTITSVTYHRPRSNGYVTCFSC